MAGQGRGDDRSPFAGLPGSWRGRAGPANLWEEGPGRPGFGMASDDEGGTKLVRPYTVTGGRTQPRYQLPIEALVTATVLEPRDRSVLAASTCDLGLVAYEMTLLVERAGRVLTPAARGVMQAAIPGDGRR